MTHEAADAVAERLDVLEAFDRALVREAHNLSRWPGLTWQQLYNRLQWEDEPLPKILKAELRPRSAGGARPWVWTRTRRRESEGLIQVLAGHSDFVGACAISPDGSFVVSASLDKRCRIWDVATGRGRAVLAGHTNSVYACAISPDGSFVVSASDDNTCRIWDAATGRERAILALSGFSCVALHPWKPLATYGDSLYGFTSSSSWPSSTQRSSSRPSRETGGEPSAARGAGRITNWTTRGSGT